MNIKISVLIMSMALAACSPGKETKVVEKTIPVVKKETVVSGLDSDPVDSEFKIITTKTYDGEKLYLNFKPNRSDLRILLLRRTKSSKITETTKFEDLSVIDSSEATDTLSTEKNDISPWSYTYEFVVSHPSFKEKETITQNIFQKKNFIVSKNTKISDLEIGSNEIDLGDLKIAKDAVLTLNGPSVKIRVENFIAEDGASIENMTKSDAELASQEAEPGKDGGIVRFEANNASGSLKIYLRGAKGGTGPAGVTSTVQGGQGPQGARGEIRYPRFPREPRVLSSGGHQVASVMQSWGYEDPVCKSNPGPGGQGYQGGQGGSGGTGAKGGDTGSMDLSVNSGSLTYSIELLPGLGGDGGPGGAGGPGGPGGPGGDTRGVCSAAANGPQGPQGAQGPSGAKGLNGAYGSFCTFRNGASFSCVQEASYSGVL